MHQKHLLIAFSIASHRWKAEQNETGNSSNFKQDLAENPNNFWMCINDQNDFFWNNTKIFSTHQLKLAWQK